MQILKNTVVSLIYTLKDTDGTVLDQTTREEPMVYLHGGYDGIFPTVEEALQGKNVGDSLELNLDADDAFGEFDEDLIRVEEKSALPAEVEVGMMFEAEDPDTNEILYFTVREINGDDVVLDGNHPLAGKDLVFSCTVSAVREATQEELDHGHTHGEDGHHTHH